MWKEWRENVKWTLLPALLILGPIGVVGLMPLLDHAFLLFGGLVMAVFGAALGFVQIHFESSGDKRSLLLHRPLSSTGIFLCKAIVGVGLYLLSVSIPLLGIMRLAATPEHIPQPFDWPMVLPWVADALTGLVCYFGGMLAAQREARWYGSKCLGIAAGFFCWYLVWTLSEFWQALLAIGIVGGTVALAAWGSFSAGGAYASQPRIAKIALAATLLMGLSALGFTGKVLIGAWYWPRTASSFRLDRHGTVLLVEKEKGRLRVTDLEGKVPAELEDVAVDAHELDEIAAPQAPGPWPTTRSYRNSNRAAIKYGNDTQPGNEWWWYVPSRGRLVGYDKAAFRPIGSFGPEGFSGPDQQPIGRFEGELIHGSMVYSAWANNYLVFPSHVYKVDFRKRVVRSIFVPEKGETVRWAARWEDEKRKRVVAFVATDQAIHVVDDMGTRKLSLPMAQDLEGYQVGSLGRLEEPTRYWVWYEPAWYLEVDELEKIPSFVVMYDDSGREISPRQSVAPRPGLAREIKPRTPPVDASAAQAWLGLLTPPVEAAVLVAATQHELSKVRASQGAEISVMLQVLIVTTPHFLPGVRWSPQAHWGLVMGFAAAMGLSALLSGLGCLVLARRQAFSGTSCIGWTGVGLAFGWVGLVSMLALHELPARIGCPKCGKRRVVTRDRCEHCGADHAHPVPDGTEIMEVSETTAQARLHAIG
jgi:hypothetical protein